MTLLDGELEERARRAIARVRQGLPRLPVGYPSNQGIQGDSVLDVGRLGQAVFWTFLAEVDGGEEELERALECLGAAIDELAQVRTSPNLYAGFLGAGWVTEYLRPHLVEDGEDEDGEDDDPNLEIDEALLQGLDADSQDNPNLFGGFVGSGVYALERWPRPAAGEALERIVASLAKSAERSSRGIAWRVPPEALDEAQRAACPEGYFNLGLGHGIPGVAVLLAGVLRAGVAVATVRELLAGTLDWLLSVAVEIEGEPAFPRFVIEGREPPPRPPGGASSWCFGDPGVAVALFEASRVLGHLEGESMARALAAAAARRFEAEDEAAGEDPGFCHGLAGTAHVFHRLYRATGEPACGRAARCSFERLLARWEPERGETGFLPLPLSPHLPMPDAAPQPREVGGLLRGVAGIGLALLAAVSDREPGWDRLMLLSLRDA